MPFMSNSAHAPCKIIWNHLINAAIKYCLRLKSMTPIKGCLSLSLYSDLSFCLLLWSFPTLVISMATCKLGGGRRSCVMYIAYALVPSNSNVVWYESDYVHFITVNSRHQQAGWGWEGEQSFDSTDIRWISMGPQ